MSFTIKDLENLSGIKAHTIRIWEQRYDFLKPKRTGTNIRNYSNEELKTVLNVALLNKYGYKISHINKMYENELHDKILSLTQTEAQQERITIDLLKNMVDMDMESFEIALDSNIETRGIEKTILNIIFPFLKKIGVLWQTSHIIPSQEHLVSNIIRQKLCVGIDGIKTSLNTNRSVCCFLPEGEFHELGLLYMHYFLKSRGINVIYLGANVPLDDLDVIVKNLKPDFIFTHLTTLGHHYNFERVMNMLLRKFPSVPIILTGNLANNHEKKIPAKINYKRSPSEVLEFITEN